MFIKSKVCLNKLGMTPQATTAEKKLLAAAQVTAVCKLRKTNHRRG